MKTLDDTRVTQAEFERLPLQFGTGTFLRWSGWSREQLEAAVERGDIEPLGNVKWKFTKWQLSAVTGFRM